MAKIRNIAIHHSGGVGNNNYASSFNLTWEQVNAAHKARWNFPSEHIENSYGGYNFIYDPKTGFFHQFRAIGEETAAQIGYNFDTVSVCIIGNYSINPKTGFSVDILTPRTEENIAKFVLNLISGEHGYLIKPGTKIELSTSRVFPHRHYQPSTECYGTALSNSWIQDVLAKYSKVETSGELRRRNALMREIERLLLKVARLREKLKVQERLGGASPYDRECEGFTH